MTFPDASERPPETGFALAFAIAAHDTLSRRAGAGSVPHNLRQRGR